MQNSNIHAGIFIKKEKKTAARDQPFYLNNYELLIMNVGE